MKKKNIKGILSIGLSIALIAGSTVAESKNSTSVLPPATQPGGSFLLGSGTGWLPQSRAVDEWAILGNTTKLCPASTTPHLNYSLIATELGTTSQLVIAASLGCWIKTIGNTYQAGCNPAVTYFNNGTFGRVAAAWTIYCDPPP